MQTIPTVLSNVAPFLVLAAIGVMIAVRLGIVQTWFKRLSLLESTCSDVYRDYDENGDVIHESQPLKARVYRDKSGQAQQVVMTIPLVGAWYGVRYGCTTISYRRAFGKWVSATGFAGELSDVSCTSDGTVRLHFVGGSIRAFAPNRAYRCSSATVALNENNQKVTKVADGHFMVQITESETGEIHSLQLSPNQNSKTALSRVTGNPDSWLVTTESVTYEWQGTVNIVKPKGSDIPESIVLQPAGKCSIAFAPTTPYIQVMRRLQATLGKIVSIHSGRAYARMDSDGSIYVCGNGIDEVFVDNVNIGTVEHEFKPEQQELAVNFEYSDRCFEYDWVPIEVARTKTMSVLMDGVELVPDRIVFLRTMYFPGTNYPPRPARVTA